ncbi:GNAT family N-acetyltransferase [Corynebacterium sp. 153RC1]|uniref:GNAT family N-acetyltransferase n=2 Tax=unclassified Corynebacterium TaxID=2624378 RepID=UPI00211C1A04|nr:GNAT family N-acetyltransferase [Corynebacterium sp. 209RC1]MCQ9354771.1 GNAT family N-acetyltransferase [Corynebacterium sp. 1222RC1]MCQ9356956.1 GNAT family N-acetyltransferase [Corynebacterium sp. 122RC1]MCQ9359039.1 GNAT family N-acetyltransferase [Corynebacterium sp. 142RC1]MCQ9361424.1 GNAT family N-acetyltransferase [Corynebacterium sp. 153RC1]MCQ9363549.1 GNAT family N-acetyltransferase [Corynebacterium sp. 732RC1]MCQ9365618.1 GNAT family N-acetyltransferase [Corynebacterium sp. 70
MFLARLFERSMPAVGAPHPRTPGFGEYTETVEVSGHKVRLRPLEARDGAAWRMLRIADQQYLQPVEPTVEGTWTQAHSSSAWRAHYIQLRELGHAGAAVACVIEVDGQFAGQVTIGNITRGVANEAWIGYWVASRYTGRGIGTIACALGTRHAFQRVGVHRLTATHLPENIASEKILEHNGFRREGFLLRNLHIDGQWRDHYLLAQTVEEYQDWLRTRRA